MKACKWVLLQATVDIQILANYLHPDYIIIESLWYIHVYVHVPHNHISHYYICCRQTRKYMQRVIKPGIKLIDMCETLEETARTLVEANGLTSGSQVI